MSDRRDTKKQLEVMTESDLMNLKSMLGSRIEKLGIEIAKKQSTLALVKNEIGRRAEQARTGSKIIVSDHAIVRYLERHKGIDMDALRAEIREIAKTGKAIDGTDRIQNGKLMVSMRKGNIATVMTDEELSIYDS